VPKGSLKYHAQVPIEWLAQFQSRILTWYHQYGRDLPWRRSRDPYAIIVSEILLHQTQVQSVLSVYARFLDRFPTVFDLAAADVAEVKAITDPLGYKIRGLWLHQIAVRVVTERNGEFPHTVEELSMLPGVGRYTAGAVLSFAFEQKAPILDTNVNRFLGRYFGIDYRSPKAEVRHHLWALAEAVVPDTDVHAFNQALMDLGALVCVSRKPLCMTCPVYAGCLSGGPAEHVNHAAEDSVQYQLVPKSPKSMTPKDSSPPQDPSQCD
jgi:A/G-specific adenine glycosylase